MFGEQGMMWKGVVVHYSVYCPYISLNNNRKIIVESRLHVQLFARKFSKIFSRIAYVIEVDIHLFEKTAREFSNILPKNRLLHNIDRHRNRTRAKTAVRHSEHCHGTLANNTVGHSETL